MADVDDATIQKAGKVLGQTEKEAGRQSTKADKQADALKRAYLTAVAKAIVWAQITNAIEEDTQDDIEVFAERVGLSIEDLAKSNPKSLIKDLARDAKNEAADFLGSGEIDDTLDIDASDMLKALNSVRI